MARRILLAALLVASVLLSGSVVALSPLSRPIDRVTRAEAGRASAPAQLQAANATRETLNLAFVGDIMAHTINLTHKPYSAIYSAVEPTIVQADLAFANLEFTVDPSLPTSGYPRFNVHPDYVEAAVHAGFKVFSVANNHVFDYGTPGITATIESLEKLKSTDGIHFSGIRLVGTTPMAPTTIELDGWRIGFLAITEFVNGYLTPGQVNIVNYRDPGARKRFLERLTEMTKGYDLFILSVHGGVQYSLEPNAAKAAFLREAAKAGATIVWAQHPHVLQPWAIMKVDGSDRLIINSNGNFISGQISEIDPEKPSLPRTYTGDSAIFHVQVRRGNAGASVASVYPELTSNYKNADGEMVVQPLDTLARAKLPSVWHAYYSYRLGVTRSLTRGEVVGPGGDPTPALGPSDFAVWSASK